MELSTHRGRLASVSSATLRSVLGIGSIIKKSILGPSMTVSKATDQC